MKLLIIEEEGQLAKSISQYLMQERYICDIAHTIAEGKLLIDRSNYDCIILNPGDAGLPFLKDLRKERNTAGIIIISERNTVTDTITSLKLGADDFMPKPIHLDELNARIEALIRRKYLYNNDAIPFRNLRLNTLSKTVTIDDKEIDLTKSEYGILFLLLIKKGLVVTKEEIAVYLSGQSDVYFYNFDILYTHIKNLKKKLFPIGNCIRTIYGTGYKLLE